MNKLLLILLAILAGVACGLGQNQTMVYMTRNGTGSFVERQLALTPGTFLRVGENATLSGQALGIFSNIADGLVPAVNSYSNPMSVPQGVTALGPNGWTTVASQSWFSNHYNDTENPHGVTAAQVGAPSLNGNNNFTGNNTFSGNTSFSGNVTTTFSRVNIGTSDFGWTYNPAAGGQIELRFPGGVAAFYQTGSPAIPYMYFPGSMQADYISGNITASSVNADGLTGRIPNGVMRESLSQPLQNWWGDSATSTAGIVWAATGPLAVLEPTPAGATYFPVCYVEDGGTDLVNSLTGQYKGEAAFSSVSHPSAAASLDFPSIAAGGSASLTITVSGVSTTNTPAVSLGWSAALPAGIVVSHARVSASNTVTVTLSNITGSAIDPAAVTCRASVTQY